MKQRRRQAGPGGRRWLARRMLELKQLGQKWLMHQQNQEKMTLSLVPLRIAQANMKITWRTRWRGWRGRASWSPGRRRPSRRSWPRGNRMVSAAHGLASYVEDADYLVALLREIAANQVTADGRAVHEAQSDLLAAAEDLFARGQ
ncbi:unnamed protein product, partial [Heterosigma akashiwo]